MKVALVHDYLVDFGGAERVLEALHELFPQAPIYTTIFLPNQLGPHRQEIESWPIKTSILQKFPFKKKLISLFRLISPWALKKFDFSQFDVVIVSATGAYTPNVIKTNPKTLHLCYCHTPPRYLYGYPTARNWRKYWWGRISGEIVNHFLRMTDYESAQNVDFFIANSQEIASRIRKFYRKKATVIYPPIDVKKFTPEITNYDYYLTGGRLARAKRIDLAIRACAKLNLPLKVFGKDFAGYGDELKALAGPTIEFLGEVSDQELPKLFANCLAYIHCSDQEDFGIIPVEVMAAGRPIIAYRSGGVQETVTEGKTGIFFDKLTVESLIEVINQSDVPVHQTAMSENCRKQAQRFSKERFKKEIFQFVEDKLKLFK